jgi:hypothetical protein
VLGRGGGVVVVSLNGSENQTLREIAQELAVSDPGLCRRLSAPSTIPQSAGREVAVIAVLIGWMAAGFAPLALGIAWRELPLIAVGALTLFVVAPLGMWASLGWVRRHRFVSFRAERST